MSYYYWDDTFTNAEGLSLEECKHLYGTKVVKGVMQGYNIVYKVVFLDKKKSLKNSWMLWFRDRRGKNVPVNMYEKDEWKRLGTI